MPSGMSNPIYLRRRRGSAHSGAVVDSPVVVQDGGETATLSNGIISATVKKLNGNLTSLNLRGVEVLSHGEVYMNLYGETPGQAKTQEKPGPVEFRISQDPSKNQGSIGEVVLRYPYHGQPKAVPMDIEIRYTLRRGDSGLYAWTIAHHEAAYPPFNIEAGTICMKLDPDVFDYLSVDQNRQRQMISGTDWMKGKQLNLKEARRMTTGLHAGDVEHKYDYSALFAQTPAYGWSSTTKKVGVWVVSPSLEYLIGSPIRVDLTGHIDLKDTPKANPTLLYVWHSNHYGGKDVQVNAGETWEKIVGPILFYCNAGESPQSMWKDAVDRAAAEQKQWPYSWADAPGYPHVQERGGVSGQLVVNDPQDPHANAGGAWIGLAAEPYTTTGEKGQPIKIDWQCDGKHYQYWSRVDSSGRFTIPNARPGNYVLYAFNGGILGDFSHSNVQVESGKTTNLGTLTWTPVRYGKQVWDIGVPDRSAAEFRHGDHYWQWGLYNLYPEEFPNDVDFVVGKSDWHKDWNYVQPPKPDGQGGVKETTWRIRFAMNQPPEGTATLRLAICGVRGGPVDVTVNGKWVGTTGELPDSGTMHRDGIRGVEAERAIHFDASILKSGPQTNVIELTKHARLWTDGVLYDYLRLELDPQKHFTTTGEP